MKKTSFITIALLLIQFCLSKVISQENLVPNSSFETVTFYTPPLAYGGAARDRVSKINDWGMFFGSGYCNCEKKYLDKRKSIDSFCETNDNFQPKSGCNMMGMTYSACSGKNSGQTISNCSGYVFTKLKSPLQVGKIYSVSFWLYLPKIQFDDTTIVEHIGFLPLRQEPIFYELGMLNNATFTNQTVVFDKWFKQEWTFRPTCDITHIMMGVFQTEEWKGKLGTYNPFETTYYYIDDVEVREVLNTKDLDIASLPYYCKDDEFKAPPIPKSNAFSVHFETNSAEVSNTEKSRLDSFYVYMKRYPQSVFKVTGHTDDVGSNHIELSKRRADSVAQYFIDKYKTNPKRLLIKNVGDSEPLSNLTTEDSRAMNRRVEIQTTKLLLHHAFYRDVLDYIKANQLDSAKIQLQKWRNATPFRNLMYVYFDDRLQPLRKLPFWEKFQSEIREQYKKQYQKGALAFQLDSMSIEDQRYRSTETKLELLTGVPIEDAYRFDYPKITQKQWDSLDNQNNIGILRLISLDNFPMESQVGSRGASTAFLIIAHSLDTMQMKTLLPIIENLCRKGEASWQEYAILTDKIQTFRKKPQLFGTQFTKVEGTEGTYKLYQHEPLEILNQNRLKYGLPLLTPKQLLETRSLYYTHLRE